jgi:hypothetical protein
MDRCASYARGDQKGEGEGGRGHRRGGGTGGESGVKVKVELTSRSTFPLSGAALVAFAVTRKED